MVTEECLLDPSRNPQYSKAELEAMVSDYLGISKVIWLWAGMAGDTEVVNGHVDNMACFSKPGTVCISWTEDKTDPQVGGGPASELAGCCLAGGAAASTGGRRADPSLLIEWRGGWHGWLDSIAATAACDADRPPPTHPLPPPASSQYERSARNVAILEASTDAKGRKFEIIKVPCPPPMFRLHAEADGVDVSFLPAWMGGCLRLFLPSLEQLGRPARWYAGPGQTSSAATPAANSPPAALPRGQGLRAP
jgi:hypothetical protein